MQSSLFETLETIAHKYPEKMVDSQINDIPRIRFHIMLALESMRRKVPSEVEIMDLGGGIGLFSVGCAASGLKRTVLVDDFNDTINRQLGSSILELHRSYGVEVVSRDCVADGVDDIEGFFDVITTFDSMEHWHHSPKRLFRGVVDKLKAGGTFILGVPNCVNLRKRITIPFGFGKWSGMQEWYDVKDFRGHVREPDVSDLKYIARDLGLVDIRIIGRNWLGHHSANAAIRIASTIIDHPLRTFPSLCSDIYLMGRKPENVS